MQLFFLKFAVLATAVSTVDGRVAKISQLKSILSLVESNAASVTQSGIAPAIVSALPGSTVTSDLDAVAALTVLTNRIGIPIQAKQFRRGLMPIKSLDKRVLKTPADYKNNVTSFFMTEYEQEWADHLKIVGTAVGRSTGFVRALGPNAYNGAVSGLHGCTSIIVVSKSAMWLSHFWEIPSFRRFSSNFRKSRREEDMVLFDETVLNQMAFGGPDITGLQPYTVPGADFDKSEDPQVIIMTPRIPFAVDDELEYEDEITEIKSGLAVLFPAVPPMTVDYLPRPSRALQNDNPAGKILVQYDPMNEITPSTEARSSYHGATIRVWVEDQPQPVLEKKWAAKDSQKLDPPGFTFGAINLSALSSFMIFVHFA